MTDRSYDMNAWMDSYKETWAAFSKAQHEGFKVLERFARFQYAVAGDYLEAALAHAKAALTARAAGGTQALSDLLAHQAELGTQLSEKLKARAAEFSTLASEVQEQVNSFATEAAHRATGTRKAA
jgi:hypothetical protein